MSLTIKYTDEEHIAWDGLAFSLKFDGAVEDAIRQQVRDLVHAWFLVGVYAGFGGHLHNMAWKDQELNQVHELSWIVDMGSVEKNAFDVLIDLLSHFGDLNNLVLRELTVGD